MGKPVRIGMDDGDEPYMSPKRHFISRTGDEKLPDATDTSKVLAEQAAQVMTDWKNPVEKWAFRLCPPVLGLASIATGLFINRHFRETLYLITSGRISSFIIMTMFPGIAASTVHYVRVTEPLVSNQETCPMCTQVRASISQLFSGVVYPGILAPLVSLPMASRQKSYNQPKITRERPFQILAFTRDVYKPIVPTLLMITAAQIVLSMGITFFEQYMYYTKILPAIRLQESQQANSESELDPRRPLVTRRLSPRN